MKDPCPDWLTRVRNRCSRVTSPGREFIPQIDGLRFVAIALVLLYHLHDHLTQRHPAIMPWREQKDFAYGLFGYGHLGVQLFFVLSGFILALPFAKQAFASEKSIPLTKYYKRRLSRLEPPYLINLLVFFGLLILIRGDSWQSLLGPLAASATYTHNLVYGEMSRINFVAWSLEIEAQFYLIAPLLFLSFSIRNAAFRRTTFALIAVASAILQSWLVDSFGDQVPRTIIGSLPFFIAGLLVADIHLSDTRKTPVVDLAKDPSAGSVVDLAKDPSAGSVVDLAKDPSPFNDQPSQVPASQTRENGQFSYDALVILAIVAILLFEHHNWPCFTALAFGSIVIGALRGVWFRRAVSNPWLVTIGGMCYTIYLYHFLIITAFGRLTRSIEVPGGYVANFILQSVLLLPLVLAVCTGLFLLFEKPFMNPRWYRFQLEGGGKS